MNMALAAFTGLDAQRVENSEGVLDAKTVQVPCHSARNVPAFSSLLFMTMVSCFCDVDGINTCQIKQTISNVTTYDVTTSKITTSNVTTVSMKNRGHATQKSTSQNKISSYVNNDSHYPSISVFVGTQSDCTVAPQHVSNNHMVTVPALARFSSVNCLWAFHCCHVFHLCLQRSSPKTKHEQATPSGGYLEDCCPHKEATVQPLFLTVSSFTSPVICAAFFFAD
jgi:hypothetical protein